MAETIKIKYSGKTIKLKIRRTGFFSKGLGLMFRTRGSDNLLFEFKKNSRISIHSLFVFFSFLAIWLDSRNNVLEWRVIAPFCLRATPRKNFRKIIEIPFNSENKRAIEFFLKNSRANI